MAEPNRSLVIRLTSKVVKEDRVSVRLLSKILSNVQQGILQVGKSRLEKDVSLQSRTPSIIERECELFFIKAEPGSLTATLELPPKEATLFPDYPDFAENVLNDIGKIMLGINENSFETIQQVIPNPHYRKRILSILNPIFPAPDADYGLSFSFAQGETIKATKIDKEQLEKYIGPIAELATIEEKAQEAVIYAKCIATFNKQGEIVETELLDYELFEEEDVRPYRTDKISWQGRTLKLKHEIACSVYKQDHFIVIEFEPLKIRSYAVSRDEAVRDFNEEFFLLWDEYAEESEETLSEDAIALKHYLLSLVKNIRKE